MEKFQLIIKKFVYQLANVLVRPFPWRKNVGPVPVKFPGTAQREHLETCPELAIVHGDPQGTKRANIVRAGDSNGCRLARVIRVE